MSSPSRIQSEHTRRAVIGALMGCVLAVSAGAAVVLSKTSGTGANRTKPRMAVQKVGDFSLLCPEGWTRSDPPIQGSPASVHAAFFTESSRDNGRTLVVMELSYAVAGDPGAVLETFVRKITRERIVGRQFSSGQIGEFQAVTGSIVTLSEGVPRQRWVFLLSHDGAQYLGMSLGRPRNASAQDAELLAAMAQSATLPTNPESGGQNPTEPDDGTEEK